MKNILLLFTEQSVIDKKAYPDRLVELLNESAAKDVHFSYTFFENLVYNISQHKTTIVDSKSGQDIKEFSAVYFRRWSEKADHAVACGIYLEEHRVPFNDTELMRPGSMSKLTQSIRFWQSNLPFPYTLIGPKKIVMEQREHIDDLKFPVIVKTTNGSRGEDNYLVDNDTDLGNLLDTKLEGSDFMVQQFIENDRDYRVWVLGGEIKLIIKRTRESGHKNNTSLGGKSELLDKKELPVDVQRVCVSAAHVMNRDIAGVDVVLEQGTGNFYLFEVNRAPQVETTGFEKQKAKHLAQHLAELADEQDKHEGKTIIGRAEKLTIPDADVVDLPAKVDSGAYRSSIWATNIKETKGKLSFTLLGPASPFYSGKEMSTTEFKKVQVENSFGHKQERYSVFLRVRVGGRLIKSNFTLANRGSKTYSALIGRKMLRGRFIVDVTRGEPLPDEEVTIKDDLA